MNKAQAKEILVDVLRSINREDEEINVSPEDFTEAMLIAIEQLNE